MKQTIVKLLIKLLPRRNFSALLKLWVTTRWWPTTPNTFILQRRSRKHRKVKWLAPSHKGSRIWVKVIWLLTNAFSNLPPPMCFILAPGLLWESSVLPWDQCPGYNEGSWNGERGQQKSGRLEGRYLLSTTHSSPYLLLRILLSMLAIFHILKFLCMWFICLHIVNKKYNLVLWW